MDPLYHDAWAHNIASGNWIGSKIFFRAPFYAYFLALIYKIFGHDYFISRLIQHIIGSFSCVLVYVLAKKIFNKKVALLSAIFASTYWIFIYFEGELLLDSLLVFFNLILIILLLNAAENPNWRRWIICGIILGLSAITRPNILAFIPIIWLWMFLTFKHQRGFKTIFSYVILFTLGTILIILPITIRNYCLEKDIVLIASQGGVNFYIGNNPDADGMSATFYEDDLQSRDFKYIAQVSSRRKLKSSEISNFYYKKGLRFIFSQPIASFKLFIKKLYMFWNTFEISNNQNIYFFKRCSSLIRILPIGFWLIGPLSLIGMGLSFGFQKKTLLPIFFVLGYMITVVMFFVTARYRLPLLPILIIFSCYAIFWLIEKIQKKDLSKIIIFVIITIPLFWLTNSNLYNIDKKDYHQFYFSLGNVYLKKGDKKKAEEMYRKAIIQNPKAYKVHLNLGIIYFKNKNWDKAEKEFLGELKINPKEEKAYNNLSVLYRFKKEYDKAITFAQNALETKPYYKEAHINLSLAHKEKGELKKARQVLYEGLKIIPNFIQAEFLLAYLYQQEELFDSAFIYYQKIAAKPLVKQDVLYDLGSLSLGEPYSSPEKTKAFAYYNIALIWTRRGKLDKAESSFIQAIKLKNDFTSAYSNLGNIYQIQKNYKKAIQNFKKAIQYDPKDPIYYYNLGISLEAIGEISQATRMFKKALSLNPQFEQAKRKLDKLER